MIEEIDNFAKQFGAKIHLDERLIVKTQNRYFLLNDNLRKLLSKDFFYASTYLGRAENGKFLPSFNLLRLIAEKESNKIIVDKKTAWLFICGRDIFRQGIKSVMCSKKTGDHTLVLNEYEECLGFGKIICDLTIAREGVAVENLLDLGDFLRREKQTST